jgi:hypothetical protein
MPASLARLAARQADDLFAGSGVSPRPIIGLTDGFGFAFTAVMPTNRTTLPAASSRLCRLAVEALQTTDALLAQPFNDADGDVYLVPAMSLLNMALDRLQDRMYRAQKLDQSHRAEDLTIDRMLAGIG